MILLAVDADAAWADLVGPITNVPVAKIEKLTVIAITVLMNLFNMMMPPCFVMWLTGVADYTHYITFKTSSIYIESAIIYEPNGLRPKMRIRLKNLNRFPLDKGVFFRSICDIQR